MTYFSEENVFVDLISNAGYRPYRDINVYESEREQIEQMESDIFVIKDHPERIILKYKNERIRLHRKDGRIHVKSFLLYCDYNTEEVHIWTQMNIEQR